MTYGHTLRQAAAHTADAREKRTPGKHILHTPHKTALFHGEPISPRAHLAKKPARFFHSSKPFQRRLRTALRFPLRNGWPQAPVFSRSWNTKGIPARRPSLKTFLLRNMFQRRIIRHRLFYAGRIKTNFNDGISRHGRYLQHLAAAENFMLHQVSRTIGSAALRSRNGGRAARLNRGKTASHRSALPAGREAPPTPEPWEAPP